MKFRLTLLLLLAYVHSAAGQTTVSCEQLQLHVKAKLLGAFIYDYANGTSAGYYTQYVGKDTALIRQVYESQDVASMRPEDLDSLRAIAGRLFAEKRERHKKEPKKLARIDKLSGYLNEMLSMEPDSADCEKPIFNAINPWSERYINDNSYPGTLLEGRRSQATVEELTVSIVNATVQPAPKPKPPTVSSPRGGGWLYGIAAAVLLSIGGIAWSLMRKGGQKSIELPTDHIYTPPSIPKPEKPQETTEKPLTKPEEKTVAPQPEKKPAQEPQQRHETHPPTEQPVQQQPTTPPPAEQPVQQTTPPIIEPQKAAAEVLYLPKPLGDEFLARDTQGESDRFVLDPITGNFDLIHTEANYLAIRRSFSDVLSDKAVMVVEGYGNLQFTRITTIQPGRALPEGDTWRVVKRLVVKVE